MELTWDGFVRRGAEAERELRGALEIGRGSFDAAIAPSVIPLGLTLAVNWALRVFEQGRRV
jgi:hypothetical protein